MSTLIDLLKKPGHAHMIGICGVGMDGLAELLQARGWRITGCDYATRPFQQDAFKARGIVVRKRHNVKHVDGCDLVVRTTAVPDDLPEVLAAKCPVVQRGEVLAAVMSEGCSIAVCGTHGKTTTSCFTARLLQCVNASVGWCIGGATKHLGALCKASKPDGVFVAEADESDGTLALYAPAWTLVTNIDIDHLEHFTGEAGLVDCFAKAVAQTREGVVLCADSPRASKLDVAGKRVLTYGFSAGAQVRAEVLKESGTSTVFAVFVEGKRAGEVTLPVAGTHNVLNALAAVCVAAGVTGQSVEALLKVLPEAAAELPGRRFETVLDAEGVRVVIDYAHHPVEIAAAVKMGLTQKAKRLRVVFQPHRYTRTLALGDEFPSAFAGVDEVVLCPVYAASEQALEGGESFDLYRRFRESNPQARVLLARGCWEAVEYYRHTLEPGDLLLVVGAGDVIEIADALTREDSEPDVSPYPGAKLSFFGVGGTVYDFREMESFADLAMLPEDTRVVGMGANTWISDLGEACPMVRLAPQAFDGIKALGDGEVLVGASVKSAALLDWLEANGLSGLEFLEGVPGTVGGLLRMNAGAHGDEIARHVMGACVVRLGEGGMRVLQPPDIGFGYRSTRGLRWCIVVWVKLWLRPSTPEEIRMKREALRAKRIKLGGLRTCGSVFKNPPNDSAGRLIEACGLKGFRIGGARVWEGHANIIVTDEGATASDVLALVLLVQDRVQRQQGVLLACEITGLEV